MFNDVSEEWIKVLQTDELKDICKYLETQQNITPSLNNMFAFARYTDVSKIKVIIIGQDPYPKLGQANGLAFSCETEIPASLKNIYKCLLNTKQIKEMPKNGSLVNWAKQNVLLLNTALTTEVGKSAVHADLWKNYIDKMIVRIMNKIQTHVMVFLWGNHAKSKAHIFEQFNATILYYGHPSPLAQANQQFINCNHFALANKMFSINWDPHSCDVVEVKEDFKYCSKDVCEKFNLKPRCQVVFTDGSCYPNKTCKEAVGGFAVSFALGSMRDVDIYGNLDTSVHFANNQRAEGLAIMTVLKFLTNYLDKWDSCIIITDSMFWIEMYTNYMVKWTAKDFDDKKNSDITLESWHLYLALTSEHNKDIVFRHIQSHGKNGWQNKPKTSYEYFCYTQNKYVDELCNYARKSLKPGTVEYSLSSY
jgi:uracil-DNA glycosylase